MSSIHTCHAFSFDSLTQTPIPLAQFAGKPFLVANIASRCGFHQQLHAFQQLHTQGAQILLTPCNDFGKQEPLDTSALACHLGERYQLDCPVTSRVGIKYHPHPFYQWLGHQLPWYAYPRWNYYKFIFNAQGQLIKWYAPWVSPMHQSIVQTLI